MKKGTMSTQELIGVKNFSRNGIQTNGHGEVVYFMISPTNISVLSRAAIGQKIKNLMELIMAEPNIEVICMDARENFDENKIYLDERIEDEPNGKIRELLMRDKAFLDDIQVQMSTSREFLIAYRLRNESDEQSFSVLNRVEKCINEQGSYMNHRLLTDGNTVASIDELYLFLSNLTAIEYIRNASKRVRKKNSAIILASQNIEDFLLSGIREYTKPLFSIPSHHFLFNPGNINPREFMDALQLEETEYDLIKYPERGTCLFRCGNERYLLQVIAPEYKARLFGKAGGR